MRRELKHKELTLREKIHNLNFLYYGVDYDSNSRVAYDHDERCADDYCRCSTLHPTITAIHYKEIANYIMGCFEVVNEKSKDEILKVCSTLTIDDFECNVCDGYYGEEMDSIVIEGYHALNRLEEAIDIKLARKRKLEKLKLNQLDPRVKY